MSIRRHRRFSCAVSRRSNGSSRAVAAAAVASIEPLEVRRLLTNYVVDTTLDETISNSTTSLREAILLAEGTAGDDVITFDTTVFPPGGATTTTISLTQGELQILGTTAGKVTIDAQDPNGGRVKVSGNDASRVFTVANSGDADLRGLMIADGFTTHWGGGIWNEATLALTDVTIRENNIQGAAGAAGAAGEDVFGAGLYNAASGTVTIRGSFFSTNSAKGGAGSSAAIGNGRGGNASGGGIYSLGDLTVETTDIAFNEALAGNGGTFAGVAGAVGGDGFGGAVYAGPDAVLRLIDNTYSANVSRGGNGGNGDASHSGGRGGNAGGAGVFSASTDAVIQRTAAHAFLQNPFNSNVALGGSGAGLGSTKGAGGNALGGGVYNLGNMSISGEGFIANHAIGGGSSGEAGEGSGGAVYNGGTIEIDDTRITDNHAFGGDVNNSGSTGGIARGGGLANDGDATVTASRFTENDALGGDNFATSNPAGAGGNAQGGAIYSSNILDLATTTIADNIAQGGKAGDGGSAGFAGIFAGGGAISNNGGVATIVDTTLSGNQAIGGAGGDGADFGGDGGVGLGGAIFNAGDTSLLNSTLHGNTARGGEPGANPSNNANGGGASGGAINQTIAGSLTAVNVTIAANSAIGAPGAASGLPGNSNGGGIENNFPLVSLTNTIIADNTAGAGPDLRGEFELIHSLVTTPEEAEYSLTPSSHDNLLDTPAGLGPLADNGGPTLTAKLLPGSAAINAGDDAAAIAAFGADGNDQRGDGFPRFVGAHVDIGAVENAGPAIVVSGNGNEIANGDNTPSATDFTNFGSTQQGAAAPQRTFVIANEGEDNLNIASVTLPTGYSLVGGLPAPIAPGASGSITIRLSTATAGTFAGNVVIHSNDSQPAADADFTFRVTGTITSPPPPPSGNAIRINFQPAGRPIPATYLADTGAVFGNRGNGQTYGWNLSASSFTRDRNINSDQRKDTLVHTQLFGSRTWEIQVPNGTYQVHLVAGDPKYFDSVYKINVENVLVINGTPSSGNRFFEATKNVVVTDGRLTISNASGAVNNKLDYIDITRVIAINFQPSGRPVPAGFLADTGSTFANRGNGFSYGWNNAASSFTRDRGVLSDQKLDTLVHTQLYGVRTWDLAVANGTYSVFITAGDPRYFDSVYRFNVEGQLAVNGTPTSGNRFVTGTKTVTVTDGKLTITNASGSVNNKLAFIEVTPV